MAAKANGLRVRTFMFHLILEIGMARLEAAKIRGLPVQDICHDIESIRGTELAADSSAVVSKECRSMIYYALVFLVVALIAGVLGFSGIAGTAANIAWILFVVGLVLAVVFFVRGRGSSI
jgi:uncharacterized membrane protein YtjA (UPF0391 family)